MTTTPTPASQPSPNPQCQRQMLEAGLIAPRTCVTCKLGPCKFEQPSPARSDKDAERADFETWMRAQGYGDKLTIGPLNEYLNLDVCRMWWGYEKRAAKAQESAPSSDLISECIEAMNRCYPVPVTPHTSVVTRAMEARAAFRNGWVERSRAALARRATAGTTAPSPAGKFVPLEPTEAMIHAAEDIPAPRPFGKVYRAMLAAAPEVAGTTAAPIYQIANDCTPSGWSDKSKAEFDAHTNTTWRKKRVVYLAGNAAPTEAVAWCVANPHGDNPPVLIYGNGAMLKPGDKLYLASNTATAAPGDLPNSRIIEIAYENGMKVRTGAGAIKFARAIEAEILASNAGAAPADAATRQNIAATKVWQEREQLRTALRDANEVAIKRGDKYGLCDQIDNHGQPYQSQWLGDILAGKSAGALTDDAAYAAYVAKCEGGKILPCSLADFLAEQAKDAARLDWLEQHHAQTYRFESTGTWRISDVFAPIAQAGTLRQAIDAAREAHTKAGGGKPA